jgi:Fe-S cluster assembly iron-binding protein IscA
MPRRKAIGKLILEDSQYKVIVGDKSYKVLFASVTYFKGKAGDEFTIVLPKDREASWAAVEAIIS